MLDAVKMLKELVAFDSVSDRSNGEVVEYLAATCREMGFETVKHTSRDERGVEKINLIATAGAGGESGLALVGHTDTVPFESSWSEALVPVERDGRIYGRGSADTKGFIAAACAAASRIDHSSLVHPLSLVFTHDEEVGCLGAKRIAQDHLVKSRYAIIGEPTGLVPVYAHKGYCLVRIVVRGAEAHSAYPDVGVNAIYGASTLVGEVEKLAGRMREWGDEEFEPPHTTLNVGVMQGGTADNVVPGSCEFFLEWRPLPQQDPRKLLGELRDLVERHRQGDAPIDAAVEERRLDPGFRTSPDSDIVRFLEQAAGHAPATVSFTTEAPQFAELGAQAVVFGPGDIRVAHRTGENVERGQVESCARILEQAVRRFCASPP